MPRAPHLAASDVLSERPISGVRVPPRRVTLAALPADICTVVVLGAPCARGVTPILAARLHGAASAANKLGVPVLVSGNGAPGERDEVGPMSAWLKERLEAPAQIAVFAGAARTFHSIVDAAVRPGPILLVTSDFHLDRALFLARGLDVDAYGLPCPTPVDSLKRAKLEARERIARVRAVMDVRLWRLRRRRDEWLEGRRS